jgi:poly(A) polymerase
VSGTAPLDAIRAALGDRPAWVVGGAVRDRLLGRATADVDVAVDGDTRAAARALAHATRSAHFELSGTFGAWRVVGRGHTWNVDLVPLRDGDIGADLAARDFTVNAMAEPVGGGELLDPHGGRADLAAARLRVVSPRSFADDPLRTLRAVRFAVELGFSLAPETAAGVAAHAAEIARVAPERVFAELKRVVRAPRVREGLALMLETGLTAAVLPELVALRGVEQNVFHHADVYDHTLEVLDAVVAIQADPGAKLGEGAGDLAAGVAALLAEPLAEELTRGDAMRFAALLHDAAKPQTRGFRPDGRVTFIGHDSEGAELARAVLRRLRASERLADYVAGLTRHHLDLGWLVHQGPLTRRAAWRYLRATEPYAADVTILTVADRFATRGKNAEPAIAAHLELAREMLAHALADRDAGRRPPLIRGDELAAELGKPPGPFLGDLLAELEEARYAGEIATRADAIAHARKLAR